jgi:hypothetical protein
MPWREMDEKMRLIAALAAEEVCVLLVSSPF